MVRFTRLHLRSVSLRMSFASPLLSRRVTMAAPAASLLDGVAGLRSRYEAAFPAVPRMHGVAAVTAGAKKAADASVTVVRLVAKEAVKAAFGGSLAAADAANESAAVAYAKEGDVEQRVILAAAGSEKKGAKIADVRKAAAAAVGKARALKLKGATLEFELPAVAGKSAAEVAEAIAQSAALANWAFDRYITGEDKAPALVGAIHVVSGGDAEVEAAVARGKVMAEGAILARDCGSERADEMNPDRVEQVARAIAAETGMAVHTIVGDELLEAGMHMHYSVGQAARYAPRYVELFHKGDAAHPEDVIAVVGKGICYDTGGLNIKATGSMEEMHMDKQGACNVLGAALAAGRLGIKRNIVFVLAVAENAIGSKAYKPHCVMRAKNGLTVMCANTDAEGRLVLGDSMYAAQERHPAIHTIIDIATLTGACMVALGNVTGGTFSNSTALADSVIAAGAARGEAFWRMPIFAEHRADVTGSTISDIQSRGNHQRGGACIAAGFIEMFVGLKDSAGAAGAADASAGAAGGAGASASAAAAAPAAAPRKPAWAHLDIAGPGAAKGCGTGFGALTLVQYLLSAPAGAPALDEE